MRSSTPKPDHRRREVFQPCEGKGSDCKGREKNLRNRGYRWFDSETAFKLAEEFLNAGKTYKGLVAMLERLYPGKK